MANFNETVAKALNNHKVFEATVQMIQTNYNMGLLTEDEMKHQIIGAKLDYGVPITEEDIAYCNEYQDRELNSPNQPPL